MLKNEPKQLSLYSILYNKIPENHILKKINNAVDFSFINKILESSYCKFYGRPAKEPEMISKLLILQYLYTLSDEQVIEDTAVNLAYMWFIGINPEVDKDARVGHKTRTDTFFGYKVEFAMITDERIITAVTVGNGAYIDGTEFGKLYSITRDCGIDIKDAYGDKAYFRKTILDILKEDHVNAYIPVSESAYKIDDNKYSYNKDSDLWFCETGNYTVKKKKTNKRNRNSVRYYFDKEGCRNCSKRKECIKGKMVAKSMEISVNSPELYEHSQWVKTEEFKEKYKNRASHEWKNGEMKRFHGLSRARGYGIRSVQTQAKLTALAVNLKRIARPLSSYLDGHTHIMVIKFGFRINIFNYWLRIP